MQLWVNELKIKVTIYLFLLFKKKTFKWSCDNNVMLKKKKTFISMLNAKLLLETANVFQANAKFLWGTQYFRQRTETFVNECKSVEI